MPIEVVLHIASNIRNCNAPQLSTQRGPCQDELFFKTKVKLNIILNI